MLRIVALAEGGAGGGGLLELSDIHVFPYSKTTASHAGIWHHPDSNAIPK